MESNGRNGPPKKKKQFRILIVCFEPRANLACEKGAQRLMPSAIRSGFVSCSPEAKFV
jgi:hypothetical protein